MLTAFVVLLTGCGGGQSSSLDGPAQVVKLYKANCISCHGNELQGKMGASTNLQKVGDRMSVAEILKQIQEGGGSMQGFASKLKEDEIKQLAEWLATKK